MKVIPAWSDILTEKKKKKKKLTFKFATFASIVFTVLLTYAAPLVAKEVQISRIKLDSEDFSVNEDVAVDIGTYDASNLKVVLVNNKGAQELSQSEYKIQSKKIKLKVKNKFSPGANRLKLIEGTRTIFDEEFSWGVLAINFNKTLYSPNETSNIHLGVLNEMGEMVCDADVELVITMPNGEKDTISTSDGEIIVNPQCNLKTFSLTPDYETHFTFGEVGTYAIELKATTENGTHKIHDSIEVKEDIPFDVERISATRIYPPNQYPVIFKIKANQSFAGKVIETVPSEFKVYYPDDGTPFELKSFGDYKTLSWDVSLKEGEETTIRYNYLAPRISPDLHLLGKLKFVEEKRVLNNVLDSFNDVSDAIESTSSQNITYKSIDVSKKLLSKNSFSAFFLDKLKDIGVVNAQESTSSHKVIDAILDGSLLDAKLSDENSTDALDEMSSSTSSFVETRIINVFEESRNWQIAADAFGDFAVYRQNATGAVLSTSPYDIPWDTTVVDTSSTFTLQANNSDIDLADAGHYLVVYNVFTEDYSGIERRDALTWLSLGGTDLVHGRAQSYIRDSGGTTEGYNSGVAIIDANAGDDLQLHIMREDTNVDGETNIRGGTNGIGVVKLYDGWDYLRTYISSDSSDISSNTSFVPIDFDTNQEVDTGSYDHSESVNPEDITLKGASGKHFLVVVAVKLNQNASSSTRQNYEMMLSLDGSEIDDTRVTAYLRGNPNADGTYNGVLSYAGIITKTSASDQILNVEVRRESQGSASTVIVGNQSGLAIVALPDGADYIDVSDNTGTQNLPSSRSAITWNQTDEEDTGSFEHDGTNISRINIDLADDYLFFGTLYAEKQSTSDGTRETIRGDWRLNGSTLIPYGGFGAFIRGDNSTTDAYTGGANGGVLLNGLTASDYLELTQINEAADATATYSANRMGLQGVSLSTLFDNIPVIEQSHFRWRDDSTALNTSGGWLDVEDTNIASDQNTLTRLRIEVANSGSGVAASADTYELQFANKSGESSCSTVTGWVGVEDSGSDAFEMLGSTQISPDGQTLTPGLLVNSEGYTFTSGEARDATDTTASIGPLNEGAYTELEFSLQATTAAVKGDTYCFRVYGTTTGAPLELYSAYPEFTVNNPDIRQHHFRWRDDTTDLNTSGGWLASEDSNVIGDIPKSTIYRLRFGVANEGTSSPASGKQYEIQFADKTGHASCDLADNWIGLSNSGSDEFKMSDTANIDPDGETTTSGLLANSEGYTFETGEGKDTADTSSTLGPLAVNYYTELEYSLEATNVASPGTTYCFRLYNNLAGNTLDAYDVYPEAMIIMPPAVGGEIAVYREATGDEDISATTFDMTWDTTVQQDSIYTLQGNNSDIDLSDGGHYLVLYDILTDLGTDGGTNRRDVVSWLSLGGSAIPYGYSYGYIRDNSNADEAYNSAGAIIEASAGDDLQAHIVRMDTNLTAAVGLRPATSGINILKLNDAWDYLRTYQSSTVSGVNAYTSFTDLEFNVNDEVDIGSFAHSTSTNPDEITLVGPSGKHFLVLANVRLYQNASSGTRQNYEMRLALGGTEIDGTRVTGYIRGEANTNGIYNSALNYAGIITKTSASDQILTVQLRRESSGSAATEIVANQSGVTIVALPDSSDYIRTVNTTGGYNLSTSRTAFTWDSLLEEDLSSFDLDGTVTSRVNIENNDDYLFFTTAYTAGTATTNREQPRLDLRIDGSTIPAYGAHGSYNRNDTSALTSGSSGGSILLNLADTSYVEMTQINEATDQGATYQANRLALQGVSLTSLFSAVANTEQLHYAWRDDSTDLNTSGGWLGGADVDPGSFSYLTTYRLRIEVANTGEAAQPLAKNYQIQYGDKTGHSTCGDVTTWIGIDDTPSDAFDMVDSTNIDPDGESANVSFSANSEGYSFINGEGRDVNDTSSSLGPLDASEYTELEYSFEATINANELTTYCIRVYDASLGAPLDNYAIYPQFTTPVNPNNAPDDPSSLVQKKVTGGSTLSTGDWTDETQVQFEADVSDADNPEQIRLCVEYRTLGNDFTNIEDQCGAYASYSGSAVTASVTVTGLNDDVEYHWQVRAQDDSGAYSGWVSYGGNAETARDYGVDSTAPTGGSVYDGSVISIDQDFSTTALDTLSANWAGFDANASGLNKYEYSIGTTQGATDVVNWTDNGPSTTATESGLTLQSSQIYYFNVRAIDNAGNIQSAVSSDGQMTTPSLTFSIAPSNLDFDTLNSANNYTDTKTATLTTSTNAYNGYIIRAYITGLLTSADTITTIQNFDGGTYVSPDEWLSNDRGFGYYSSDTTIQGFNIFNPATCLGGGNPPCYAPFSQTAPGDIVADHEALVSGTPINNEQYTITYRVQVDPDQAASDYTTTVVYTVTAVY